MGSWRPAPGRQQEMFPAQMPRATEGAESQLRSADAQSPEAPGARTAGLWLLSEPVCPRPRQLQQRTDAGAHAGKHVSGSQGLRWRGHRVATRLRALQTSEFCSI